jgi:hypothetical protein
MKHYTSGPLENLPKWVQDRFAAADEFAPAHAVMLPGPYAFGRRLNRKDICASCGSHVMNADVPAEKDFVEIGFDLYSLPKRFASIFDYLRSIPDEQAAQAIEQEQAAEHDEFCECNACEDYRYDRYISEMEEAEKAQKEFYG